MHGDGQISRDYAELYGFFFKSSAAFIRNLKGLFPAI